MVGARERVSPSNIYIYICKYGERGPPVWTSYIHANPANSGVLYIYIYTTGQEKEEAAGRELSVETEATVIHHRLSHRGGSYLPLAYLSLILFLPFSFSSNPFSVRPSCERSRTPRLACPVIPLKRIISLFETLAIL